MSEPSAPSSLAMSASTSISSAPRGCHDYGEMGHFINKCLIKYVENVKNEYMQLKTVSTLNYLVQGKCNYQIQVVIKVIKKIIQKSTYKNINKYG